MMKRRSLIIIIFYFSVFSAAAQEDYRSRIVIIPMENGTGLEQYNPLCNTITDTVSLVLEFLKDYRVLDEQDADLGRLESAKTLTDMGMIASEEGVDEVIFGRAVLEDGVFEFILSLYNVNERTITNEQSVEAFSVLEVFDAADELTEGLIGQLSDVHIAFGAIKLIQTGGKGNYTVNLDGFPLRNPDKTFRKVLNGQYDISITQERLIGKTVVFQRNIDVAEDEERVVEFSLPPGLPGEFDWLDTRGAALLALGESEESIDEFLKEITLFQNETLALEYDPELEGLRDRYLDQAGARATILLQAKMEDADASFYQKNPRFSDTLDHYETLSSLVETAFDITMLVSSRELVMTDPQKVQIGEGNRAYFSCFDQDGRVLLVTWDPEQDRVVSRPLVGKNEHYRGDFITSGGRLYLWEPGTEQVAVLDETLKIIQTIPIPDVPAGTEGIKLAVSSKGLLYACSKDIVRVIDTFRQYDDAGHLLPPDRYPGIEENLAGLLLHRGGEEPAGIFFDQARHLNTFFPGSSTLLLSDEKGNLLRELFFERCHPSSRMAADAAGYFYVTLYEENTIAKYSPSGELVTTYGGYGTAEGQFAAPAGIAVSAEGLLYVADSYNARVQILTPLTPPVLYPEIARYGEDLDRRIARTAVAVHKEKTLHEEFPLGAHRWDFIGSGLLLGMSGLLAVGADISGANKAYAYEFYQNSKDPEAIAEARDTVETLDGLHQLSEMASISALGFSSSLLTSTLLKIGLDSTFPRYNQRQAQLLDMDLLYETDPEKYRSLRASRRIGIWTGIVPPVLGLGVTLGMAFSGGDVSPGMVVGVTALGIGIPPLFSHLHGGRFSVGLLTAGLAADLLAVAALSSFGNIDNFESWDYDKYSSYESHPVPEPQGGANFSMDRMLDRFGDLSFLYLLSGAYGIRLTAGIFDARYGWTYTNNYNRYKAVKEVEQKAVAAWDWTMNPYLDRGGNLGMALTFFY